MEKHSVSVVIPAHNEEQLIGATMRRLKEGLSELQISHEIIVVNDASIDRTAAIANELGAVVENVQLRNIGAVRNAGARVAKFQNLIFVDADTLVPTKTLQATLDVMKHGSAGGALVELAEGPKIHWTKYVIFLLVAVVWLRIGRWAAGCYMFCTATAFEQIGGFPSEYFAAEEYFFSRKMKALGKFVIVKHPVQTSARKLRDYSIWQLLRFIIRPFFNRDGVLKSRRGLEILYQDQRNRPNKS